MKVEVRFQKGLFSLILQTNQRLVLKRLYINLFTINAPVPYPLLANIWKPQGVVASLSARCSILAAANPVGGHYNRGKTVAENLKVSTRFYYCTLLLFDGL